MLNGIKITSISAVEVSNRKKNEIDERETQSDQMKHKHRVNLEAIEILEQIDMKLNALEQVPESGRWGWGRLCTSSC